jgi:hypothetical protein
MATICAGSNGASQVLSHYIVLSDHIAPPSAGVRLRLVTGLSNGGSALRYEPQMIVDS